MQVSKEQRGLNGLEVRAMPDGGRRTIVGYAAIFGQETIIREMGWEYREKLEPGAFKNAISSSDIHALINHSYDAVIGRMKSGTLRLREDERGLAIEIDLPDTTQARDLEKQIERGDIDQMSFQFSMNGGAQEWDESGDIPLRTIRSIGEMYDVTVCPRGAYPQTEAALRSFDAHKKQRARKNFDATRLRLSMKRKHLQLIGEKGGNVPADLSRSNLGDKND